MRFEGKTALITGASVGIGKATAEQIVREGGKVAVNSQSEGAKAVADQLGGMFFQGQVENPDDAERMVKGALDAFGHLDILINNAGIVRGGRIDNCTLEDWDDSMAVNVRGVYLMSKFALHHMLERGSGSIVHNASVCGVKGLKERASYSASKGAVVALTWAMAADYVDKGIRVNCVNPGTTLTPSLQGRIDAFDDPIAAKKMFISRQPMGRLGESEEIAAAICFLASDEASFITGAILNVDGGLTI